MDEDKILVGFLKEQNKIRLISQEGAYGGLFKFLMSDHKDKRVFYYNLPPIDVLEQIIDDRFPDAAENLKNLIHQAWEIKSIDALNWEPNEELYTLIHDYGTKRA